ncbi:MULTISPECIES: hypothetical protein [Halomonas]|uniref:hypothetical protein n=1 Tax=Halomonas TaxID=2745 RepID=UPI003CEF64AC
MARARKFHAEKQMSLFDMLSEVLDDNAKQELDSDDDVVVSQLLDVQSFETSASWSEGWYALKPVSNVVTLGERDICPSEWSDDEIISLMEGVLRYSIQQMSDAAFGRSSRLEAAAWALLPEFDEEPFSFARCAKGCGYDPEALRDGLRRCWENKWGESL